MGDTKRIKEECWNKRLQMQGCGGGNRNCKTKKEGGNLKAVGRKAGKNQGGGQAKKRKGEKAEGRGR